MTELEPSDKLKQVTDRLRELREGLNDKLPIIKQNVINIETHYTAVLADVTKHISKIKDEEMAQMKGLEGTCDVSLTRIDSMLNTIETLIQNGEHDQALLATREAESDIKTFEGRQPSVKENNQIMKYRYVPNPTSSRDGVLGKICEADVKIDPIQLDDINVKTPSDRSNCNIRGMARLPDNRLVIADYNNKKIKLLDVTTKTVTSELRLDVPPFDLAAIDSNKIAVTTYGSQKLLFVFVYDKFTFDRTIDKSEYSHCQGIVRTNDILSVSYRDRYHIEILNVDGTVKHVIENKDTHGTEMFGNVYYLTQCPDTNILYISDSTNHKVSSMTQDGYVISSFHHEYLREPRGIDVGRDGRLFVCNYSTNKVFEIKSDLTKGRVILDEKDGVLAPFCVVYSEEEHKLFVSGVNNNTVKVFLV